MKKLVALLLVLTGCAMFVGAIRPQKNTTAFDVVAFGNLPAIANGRVKPFDTVARTALLQIQGRQTFTTPDGRKPPPSEWLLDVMFRPERADTYQVFEITHPDVLAIFGLKADEGRAGKWFSFNQLRPKVAELQRQAQLANEVESAHRTPFQRRTLEAYASLITYQRLRHAIAAPDRPDFAQDLLDIAENLPARIDAVRAQAGKQPHDAALAQSTMDIAEGFRAMATWSNLVVIPPDNNSTNVDDWQTAGAALLDTFRTGHVSSHAIILAGLGRAWRLEKPADFNYVLERYRGILDQRFGPQLAKSAVETRFNAADVFTRSFVVYALAFFVAMVSWLAWPETLGRAAFWLIIVAFLVSTAGIATRMWLEGRPPVTNLYSSALFVGWVCVLFCIVLEFIYRNGIGSAAAGLLGFGTLIVADRLHATQKADTLEMMRAVLDSNFWLATHVVIVAAGYAATFLAGFLGLFYIILGLFTKIVDKTMADALSRMVYGIVCFATLFSFTGTVLGGIWADQSWGRFWGWDPKENGALIIVLWNAIILHARWGGMIKQRGLMALAVIGNIMTSWSWFGTNLLGVGLHNYGFQEGTFVALAAFIASQLVCFGLALIPLEQWRSFRAAPDTTPAAAAVAPAK